MCKDCTPLEYVPSFGTADAPAAPESAAYLRALLDLDDQVRDAAIDVPLRCRQAKLVAGNLRPCGKCRNCLRTKKGQKAYRIIFESRVHRHNAFVTLTYSDEELQYTKDTFLPTLNPKHLQDFMKRLRKAVEKHYADQYAIIWMKETGELIEDTISRFREEMAKLAAEKEHYAPEARSHLLSNPARIRFHGVGEYGERTLRPHYHLALFGFKPCSLGSTHYAKDGKTVDCCVWCELVSQAWGMGRIHVGILEEGGAKYAANYIEKKVERKEEKWLDGRYPEFSRCSNRPGLGRDFIDQAGETYRQLDIRERAPDVPGYLSQGRRKLPLDSYLLRHLRRQIGKPPNAASETVALQQAQLEVLRRKAVSDQDAPSVVAQLRKLNAGRDARADGLARLYRKDAKL